MSANACNADDGLGAGPVRSVESSPVSRLARSIWRMASPGGGVGGLPAAADGRGVAPPPAWSSGNCGCATRTRCQYGQSLASQSVLQRPLGNGQVQGNAVAGPYPGHVHVWHAPRARTCPIRPIVVLTFLYLQHPHAEFVLPYWNKTVPLQQIIPAVLLG